MIVVMNVGNTNISMGVVEERKLRYQWRFSTDKDKTADEFGMLFVNLFNAEKLDVSSAGAVIISSVVPPIMYSLEHAIRKYFKVDPISVGPGMKTGLNIKYENPREVGADRIVNAVAAYGLYGGPVIVVDFGTATTFSAISSKAEFLGGAICPGIRIAADALFQRTAKLPRIELAKPASAIGRNTVTNMQAGIVFGYIGQVDYIIRKIKNEMGEDNIKVVATGGMARLIAGETESIDEVNGSLALEGLRIIYEHNH